MEALFLDVFNMSIAASWLVAAVLVLRLFMKKAPKWTVVLLWGIVALRLVFPFSIESALSLIPSKETIPPEIVFSPAPEIDTGIPPLNDAINPVITESFAPAPMTSMNPLQFWIPVFSVIWVLGIAAMLIYTAISYYKLRKRVSTAVILRDNIYQSENAGSPFVLGIFFPKIYIPFGIDEITLSHVIAHEKAHIARKDHWWKPLGFAILTVYWFNPILWVAYILLCKDIELACDEKVISELGEEGRADYSQAILSCSINRKTIAACPVAFGEVGVKERVKSVLNYKKPAFWVILLAVIACIALSVCFLTDPKDGEESVFENIVNFFRGAEYTAFEGENGKLGVKNREGEVVVEAKYDSVSIMGDYFVLKNGDFEIELCSAEGNFVPGGPFDGYAEEESYDEKTFLTLSKEGKKYSYILENGEFTEGTEEKYPITAVNFTTFSENGKFGLKNINGEVVVEPKYRYIDIPFEDRAYCIFGESANFGPARGKAEIYDLYTGYIINESYNFVKVFTFGDNYAAFAYAGNHSVVNEPAYLPDGEPTPEGWYIIDKNGNPLNETVYSKIHAEGNNFIWHTTEITDPNTKIYCKRYDGVVEEYKISELFANGKTPSETVGMPLSKEQIEEIREWGACLKETDNGITSTEISCFFTSEYTDPRDIAASLFIEYCPAPKVLGEEDQAEFELVQKAMNKLDGSDQPIFEITKYPVPCKRLPREYLNSILKEYAGITVEEMNTNWFETAIYVPETDSFYSFSSDFAPGIFNVTYGVIDKDKDTVTLWETPDYENKAHILKLEKSGDKWLIVGHYLPGA